MPDYAFTVACDSTGTVPRAALFSARSDRSREEGLEARSSPCRSLNRSLLTCPRFLNQLKLEFPLNDPPRKTVPREIGNFGLRGSVSARLAGTIAVNVTQVMVSSKSVETGA